MIKEMTIKSEIEGLSIYMEELDILRPPVNMGIFVYSFSTFIKFLSKRPQRNCFVKETPEVYQKTRKELAPFFKMILKFDTEEFIKLILSIFVMLTLVSIAGFIIFFILLEFGLFYTLILTMLIIFLPIFYIGSIWIFTTRRRVAGEKYDENIKKSVQELIDYGNEFIRKNELDPKDFLLILRHNDYDGLIYEKKGENDYLGFLGNNLKNLK